MGIENRGGKVASRDQALDFDSNELFMHSPVAQLFVRARDRAVVACNRAAQDLFDYSRDEMLALKGDQLSPQYQPNGDSSKSRTFALIKDVRAKGSSEFGWWHQKKGGELFWAQIHVRLTTIEGVRGFLSTLIDQTIETRAAGQERLMRRLVGQAAEPFYICELTETFPIRFLNSAAIAHYGLVGLSVFGRSIIDFDPNIKPQNASHLIEQIRTQGTLSFETVHRKVNGSEAPVQVNATYYTDLEGTELVYGSFTDISVRKKLEQLYEETLVLSEDLALKNKELEELNRKITLQAHTDRLTGLLNRDGLYHHLQLQEGHFTGEAELSIFIIDIDHFKSVNDIYGHLAGDLLLSRVGKMLIDQLGSLEPIISRLGGEEFLVAVTLCDQQEVGVIAERIRQGFSDLNVQYEGQNISRTASVGIAVVETGDLFSERLSHADLALQVAKESGRDTYVIATDEFLHAKKAQGYLHDPGQLEAALRNGEYLYFAQPIIDALTGSTAGYECLIRWVEETGEIKTPQYFLNALVPKLYKSESRDIRTAMARELLESLKGERIDYVTWNFNLEQFELNRFVDDIISGYEPPFLSSDYTTVIEISEAQMTERRDMKTIKANLERLRAAGFFIALDDFGIEHSNLYRLITLPIDIIKIDKSLVRDAVSDRRVQSTIRFVSLMAASLKIRVIAEGIENAETARFLSAAKISLQQGYFHGKPSDLRERRQLG